MALYRKRSRLKNFIERGNTEAVYIKQKKAIYRISMFVDSL